jgi:3-oxoacyl-[acyl-carrier protein] reductase
MNLSLQGKYALACGSTQGIGKAAALELAQLGASVILLARSEDKLQATLAELDHSQGQQHGYLIADFSQPQAVRATVDAYLASSAHPIHILINNTGGPAGGPIVEASPEAFLAAFQMHLFCNHQLSQAVIPGMKAAGYGRIINVISTSVKIPITGLGVSNTTRGAVASWAKTLSNEVASFGITVNNVLPGMTATERLFSLVKGWAGQRGQTEEEVMAGMKSQIPAARIGDAHEIAAMIAFLASPAAAYVNGTSIPVDGGRTGSI